MEMRRAAKNAKEKAKQQKENTDEAIKAAAIPDKEE
jgi:hypothetical protein